MNIKTINLNASNILKYIILQIFLLLKQIFLNKKNFKLFSLFDFFFCTIYCIKRLNIIKITFLIFLMFIQNI